MKEFETVLAERTAAREKAEGLHILDGIKRRAQAADAESKRIIAGAVLAALWIIVGAVLVNGGVTAELRRVQAEAAALAEQSDLLTEENERLTAELRRAKERATQEPMTVDAAELVLLDAPAWEPVGEFHIYHYCACEKCTGKRPGHADYGVTATGTTATAGRTVSVDPSVIPLGSEVLIGDHIYIAEDTGVRGQAIDIFVGNHAEALELGTYTADVWQR